MVASSTSCSTDLSPGCWRKFCKTSFLPGGMVTELCPDKSLFDYSVLRLKVQQVKHCELEVSKVLPCVHSV